METLKEIFERYKSLEWLMDNPLVSFILTAVLGISLWWMISVYKNRKFRKAIKDPEWDGHLKILVTNFSGTQNPFSQGGRKVVHELHDKCIEAINKTSRQYLGHRKLKTFSYYKGLKWKTKENSQVAPSTVKQAQKLGKKLGVDLVITGKSLKNDSSNYVAVIPVTGDDVGEHETLSLDTTKGQLETLMEMLAGGVAYYVGSTELEAREGLFLAEGPAQMQVDILGPLLMSPEVTLTDAQREQMRKAYRDAIESVIKCYYFPSREALETSINWMAAEIELHPDDTAPKVLYARAQLEAHDNKNDKVRVGLAFDMLLSIPAIENFRGEEIEFWLNRIAKLYFIPKHHLTQNEFTTRLSARSFTKPALEKGYASYHCGMIEKSVQHKHGLQTLEQILNAIESFKNAESKLREIEPALASGVFVHISDCYQHLLRRTSKDDEATKLAQEGDAIIENKFQNAHPSARIRFRLFRARYEICFGMMTRTNVSHSSYVTWSEKCQIFALAKVNATKFGFCDLNKSEAVQARGTSQLLDTRRSRRLRLADFKVSAELKEFITGEVALAARGNLAITQIVNCVKEWENTTEKTESKDEKLHGSEIIELLMKVEIDLIELITFSTLLSNLYNHGNYLSYLGKISWLRSEILSSMVDVPQVQIFIALKRAALFYRMSNILHFLLSRQKSSSKIESAENYINLLKAYDSDITHTPIAVPDYLRDTMSFLDTRLNDWREQVLAPSLHFDPHYEPPEKLSE